MWPCLLPWPTSYSFLYPQNNVPQSSMAYLLFSFQALVAYPRFNLIYCLRHTKTSRVLYLDPRPWLLPELQPGNSTMLRWNSLTSWMSYTHQNEPFSYSLVYANITQARNRCLTISTPPAPWIHLQHPTHDGDLHGNLFSHLILSKVLGFCMAWAWAGQYVLSQSLISIFFNSTLQTLCNAL